ncbi:MAG: carboxy terminal-processing peptidase, partial [Lysobacterales bacterium]
EPNIRFPSAGDPQEYGERSLPRALPWTTIDPAHFQAAGDMSQLSVVVESRYEDRVGTDQEFSWLLADIADYNSKFDRKQISLLESAARAEMAEEDARRESRKAQKEDADPLVNSEDVLVEDDLGEFDENPPAKAETDAEDEGPDLLLREAARVVNDVAELESDRDLLERQFTQLSHKEPAAPQLN